jgi:Fe-S cluster biogenesis protein NfuA
MSSREKKILAKRIGAFVLILGLGWLLVHYGRIYAPKAWGNLHLINFVVNCIPTILSIVFAIVVDKDLNVHVRKYWRIGIIACGLAWSVLLWHQQTLAEGESTAQIQRAVDSAVQKSNKHTDEQFNKVQDNVGEVQKQVTGISQSLDTTKKDISSQLQKTSADLNTSIVKAGKPEPTKPAQLKFSLVNEAMLEKDFPMKSETAMRDADGSYRFHFAVKNVSSVKAEGVEIWVTICEPCSFAKEPEGFDKPAGSNEHMRHKHIQSIAPGVAAGDNSISVKVNNAPIGPIAVHFNGACDNCEKVEVTEDYYIIPALQNAAPQ